MPRYRVTMPDGRTYSINGPAGASKDQVIAAVQRRIGAKPEEQETTLGGELKEAFKGVIPGAAGLLETAATGAAALLPEEQEMAVRAKAAEMAGAARETFAAAPGYEESVGRKFGEALGSTAPLFALGPLGVAGRVAATGLGVGAGAGEARQRAETEGGEEEKGLATAAGAIVGATEAIPVFNFVKRLPQGAQLQIADRIRRAFQAGGEEGAQEAASQIAQNFIAKGLYKPDQSLIESAGEEGAYGAGVGAFIQVLTDMALGRRARPAPPTAQEKLTEPETPPTAPPGTQAAAAEDVAKQLDTETTVKQALSEEDEAAEEARLEREAIQAYEREQEELATRGRYDAQTLREAAEAEALAPVDEEGVPYTPPTREEEEKEVAELPAPPVQTDFPIPTKDYAEQVFAQYDALSETERESVAQQLGVSRSQIIESEIIFNQPEVVADAIETAKSLAVEPEYTMRDAALEVFRESGKTNVDTLRDRLAIPLQEAKQLRQSFIDEGVLVRRGNTYILQEPTKEAPPAKAEEVEYAAVRPRDIETVDVGAVGRGDVLPPSRPVSERPVVAEPATAAVERVGEPVGAVVEREAAVPTALEEPVDIEELEKEQLPTRASSIRAAALDFVRATGKADPISLQQATGIKLSEANALREALIGSGAIVPRGKNRYSVFEELKTTPTTPARAGRLEAAPTPVEGMLRGAPRPASREVLPEPTREGPGVEATGVRTKVNEELEAIKDSLRQLAAQPDMEGRQYGLGLVGGEARGVTRKKLSPAEVNSAKTLGLTREATAYAANPAGVTERKALVDATKAKHKELANRAVALQKLESDNRKIGKERVLSNGFFRNVYSTLSDPQVSIGQLVAAENKIKTAEAKYGGAVAPQIAVEQATFEEDTEFREAVKTQKARAEEREEAEKAAREERRRTRKKRDIGLRFERGTGMGMDADRVYDIATKAAANWKNKPRIFVVQSVDEVPESIRDRVPDDTKGFYVRGDVFIIADNATTEAGVRATLFHESLGHFGLSNLFGRRLRKTMLDIYRTNPAMTKAADKWLQKYPDSYEFLNANDRKSMAVEEVLAEASGKGVIKDAGIRAAFNRFAAMVRKFIRGMGIQINYSNNDIRQILIEAHDTVVTRERESRLGEDGDPRFQRKQAKDRLSNVFDVNITAPKYDNQIGDGVRGALGNVYENLREGAISFLSIPQIAEVWQKELPAVEKLDIILGRRGSKEMMRREVVSKNVTGWFELANKYKDKPKTLDRFFQVANMTTIYQVDPLKDSVQAILKKPVKDMTPLDKVSYDIVSEYNSLPADLRKAYKDMREDYEKSSKEFEFLLEQRLGKDAIDRIKGKYDNKKLEVYLPLWRDGNYWLTYTDKNGETISSAYASDIDRQRAKDAALKEGAKDVQEFSRLREARRGAPPTGFLGDIVKALEEQGVPDDAIDAVYESYLNYLPAESIRQLRRPRESSFDIATGVDRYGVFGFEPDIFQAYANVAPRIANQLTNLEYAIPLEETMKELYQQSGGERVRNPVHAAVYRNLQKQVNFIRNPEPNWLVDGASYFSYLWFIAGNISSALINTTQLPMVVMPLIGGKYGPTKAFSAMENAISTYFNGGWDSNNGGKSKFPSDFTFGTAKNLKPEHRKLYRVAVERSAIRRSTGYEITEAQKTGVKDFVGIKARVTHGLGWLFQNSERFNREVTLLAAFDLAYEDTKDVDKAIEEALKVVNDAHGSALAETGPRLFQQGFGKVMFTFKRFAQAQIYLLSRLFKQAFGDADAKTREIARSQLIGIFGSSFLIAGLQGMPLYGAVEMLANLLMGDDDEPYDFTAYLGQKLDETGRKTMQTIGMDKYVDQKFSEMGRKGLLNQMIGVDVASRTGFNGLIWRDDPKRMAEVGPFLYTLEQAMGPAYGAFLSAQRGVELFGEGEYMRSIEAMTPSFVRNGFKAIRMAEEGVRNKDGTPVVEDISKYNLMMQLVGFNPAEVAEARERAGARNKMTDKLLKRRAALLDQYYAAWQENDRQGMSEAMNDIQKYNEKNPYRGLAIFPETIIRSIKSRRRRQLLSVDGLYTNPTYMQRVNELSGQ